MWIVPSNSYKFKEKEWRKGFLVQVALQDGKGGLYCSCCEDPRKNGRVPHQPL